MVDLMRIAADERKQRIACCDNNREITPVQPFSQYIQTWKDDILVVAARIKALEDGKN
jgi:hypothetical protein